MKKQKTYRKHPFLVCGIKQFPLLFIMLSFLVTAPTLAQDSLRHEVLLETSKGSIRVALYNETPLHRDNFIKNVSAGIYDGLLFHRVISNFMIQGGDTASRNAAPGQLLGGSAEAYSVPAEIRYPQFFHKRGALAAARQGDIVNPERRSSSTQFYIVYGTCFTDDMLDKVQRRLKESGRGITLTPEVRDAYMQKGGTPHLDGQYTVFGEVTEGLDVVREIQWCATDANDRPIEDVRIIKATVVR